MNSAAKILEMYAQTCDTELARHSQAASPILVGVGHMNPWALFRSRRVWRMLMSPLRSLVISLVFLALYIATPPCQAAFHQWRFGEIYSSANGSVQFIELVNPTGFTTETVSGTAEIRTDSGNVYDFPANLTGNTANKRLLISTDNFESIPGAVTPNFSTSLALPPNFFNPAGDRLRLYQPTVGGEFTSVTWTAATAVPTDNVFSRLVNTACTTVCTPAGIAVNSPTNFNGSQPGITGSINRGDYNGDGFMDAADYPIFRKTFGDTVSPAGKGADGDANGTIGDGDHSFWTTRFGQEIWGDGIGSNGSSVAPEPATLSLAVAGLVLLARRRRRSAELGCHRC
jgi:hypothetical protein